MERLMIKVLFAVALLILAVTAGRSYLDGVYHDGYDAAKADRAAQDAAHAARDTVAARADEQTIADAQRRDMATRNQKEQDREKYIATLERRLRDGTVSLSIATATIRATDPGKNSCTAPGPTSEERTRIVPEAAVDFIGVARSSARDVRDYNALMVEYERMRAQCNKGSD